MKVLYGHCHEPRYIDFEKTKSLFITGAHSIGKSTLIHFLLHSLFTKSKTRNLKLTLFDANQVEFKHYYHVDSVHRMISRKSELEEFLREFNSSEYHPGEMHFFVIDDLDFFDFGKYSYELCQLLFNFLKEVNASSHMRIIAGCSFVYNNRNYIDLATYFQSKFLFLFPDYEDLKIAGGFEIAPQLGKNEFVAFANNECHYPVSFKDIDDREIITATTKFSIKRFKEYELQRIKEAQG